jgi:DNA repair protein RecN (Recombination protein N)
VLVITHLAQVAALASRHFVIDKASESGNTVARLTPVTGEMVTLELCRMLGGRTDDAEAMAHARDLRDRAAGGLLD